MHLCHRVIVFERLLPTFALQERLPEPTFGVSKASEWEWDASQKITSEDYPQSPCTVPEWPVPGVVKGVKCRLWQHIFSGFKPTSGFYPRLMCIDLDLKNQEQVLLQVWFMKCFPDPEQQLLSTCNQWRVVFLLRLSSRSASYCSHWGLETCSFYTFKALKTLHSVWQNNIEWV